MSKRPLIPRGRVGKAVPIEPNDYEPARKPNPPSRQGNSELNVGLGLVLLLVCSLLVIFLAQSVTDFAR